MAHSGYESRSKCQKRYMDKSKDNGTCKDCSNKSIDGKRRCQYHLDYQKKYRDSQSHGTTQKTSSTQNNKDDLIFTGCPDEMEDVYDSDHAYE